MSLEKRYEETLNYYYEMLEKYIKLNSKTKNRYLWRQRAIEERIDVLELLKQDFAKDFDECYEEVLR